MFGRSCRAARLIETQPSKNGLHSGTNPIRIDRGYAIAVATSGNSPASSARGQSARSTLGAAEALIRLDPMRVELQRL